VLKTLSDGELEANMHRFVLSAMTCVVTQKHILFTTWERIWALG